MRTVPKPDGMDMAQEIENGAVSTNYLRTLNMDEPLARLTTNSLRFYQTDALGSVTALTDETGAIRTQYTYDPFGNVSVSGETSDNPFQYTGRENDETGLYYYRARYYSPELQRFISEDPIGFAGGLNFYSYVENDPILSADPLGLFGSGDKPPPPVEKNKKKDKGGPWHPPLGIKTKCLPTDSFSTLRNKIYINEKRLKSHKGWDEHMPSPRGGGKHAEDIKQIMTELAACKALDELKCGCKDGQGIPSLPKPETPFPIPPIVID